MGQCWLLDVVGEVEQWQQDCCYDDCYQYGYYDGQCWYQCGEQVIDCMLVFQFEGVGHFEQYCVELVGFFVDLYYLQGKLWKVL